MATIDDVAREAGVSIASVSRVISGARSVRPKTRNAVLAAAEKLGYQANYFASALRRGTSMTVGMIVPQISNPFFVELVEKVEHAVQGQGFDLLLCDSQNDPAIEMRRARALRGRQVDGIVLICADEVESQKSVQAIGEQMPVVTLDRAIRGTALDRIVVDNELGIRLVVEHLRAQGLTRTVFVGAGDQVSSAATRRQAYERAIRDVGGSGAEDQLHGSFSVAWGSQAAKAIAGRETLPDAVVCANDLIAVGVIRGALEAGLRVPEDIAVTGFDDIALCRYVDPGITTVRQPIDTIARETASILLARIRGEAGAVRNVLVSPELVVRESSRRGTA